uniref:Uncharacterized protein n=1 Tax=Avena sativa TaxID=4498 RepID=A0ACD5V9B5_AVESA
MGGGAADERQRRVVSRAEPTLQHQLQEMASLPIPDELLGEILLRLPTPADLARASAACVAFRRVTADRSFLRRYRKLHTPPLLGFLEESKFFHAATQPYPSASAASAVAVAADFSFSFLPAPACSWFLRDTRDGRVLLDRPMRVPTGGVFFPEVVVCDPLHRRYLLLPPVPDDLASTVEDLFWTRKRTKRLSVQIFLVPTGDEEEAVTADETSFRVICMAQCKARLVAFVFSSNTGQWRAVPPRRWIDLSADLPRLTSRNRFYHHQYVYGCFYWTTGSIEESKLLVLDIKTMEFSIAKPPPEANGCLNFVMVEAGEGRPGMFVVQEPESSVPPDNRPTIIYFIRQNDGGSSSRWHKVKATSLDFRPHFVCNMEKYPLLYQVREQSSQLKECCFTMDIETFQLEKVCYVESNEVFLRRLRAYRNFPPSLLSSPTISNGVEKKAEKEMLEQGCAGSSSAESPRSG